MNKDILNNEYLSHNQIRGHASKLLDKDMVNHPDHYKSDTGLEVIDVIEAFTQGLSGIEATDTGNIIKYICRWKKKNGVEDLKKIRWYVNHLIKHLDPKEKIPAVTDGGYFKCPKCGGDLKRDIIGLETTEDIFSIKPIIQLRREPHCVECGRVYNISISEDLTVCIEPSRLY